VERSRERTKAERERYVAAEAITGLITKLLKKTRLQVKVVVEVIHCKSPKHLLTEIV
jgi:restriction endonuclease